MTIAFIGDIIGRPGREAVALHLPKLKQEHVIDVVIANGENASHGFGINPKNASELLGYGIDVLTMGNHTWDRKEIIGLLDDPAFPIIRPINYEESIHGKGYWQMSIKGQMLTIINAMGIFAMPHTRNPFTLLDAFVDDLNQKGHKHIFIDFHAEATAEKRTLMMMLKGKVGGIIGTHTHVGSDDLQIHDGTAYATDIGLTGCYDNVIGLDSQAPIKKVMTGLPAKFDVQNNCKRIFQMIIMHLDNKGSCKEAYKLRCFEGQVIRNEALEV